MKKTMMIVVMLIGICGLIIPAFAGDHQVGLGGHYWKTIDDSDDVEADIDTDTVTLGAVGRIEF